MAVLRGPADEADPIEPHEPGLASDPEIPRGILRDRPDSAGWQALALVPRLQAVVAERIVDSDCLSHRRGEERERDGNDECTEGHVILLVDPREQARQPCSSSMLRGG